MHYKAAVMTSLVDLVFIEVIISTRQRLFLEGTTKTTHHLSPFSRCLLRLLSERPSHPSSYIAEMAEVSDINLLFL